MLPLPGKPIGRVRITGWSPLAPLPRPAVSSIAQRALAGVKPDQVSAFSAAMKARVESAIAARGGRR